MNSNNEDLQYCNTNTSMNKGTLATQDVPSAENLGQALKLLGPNSFVDFDLGITEEESTILNSLNVDCFGNVDRFGRGRGDISIDISKFHSECTAYFKSMGNDDELSSSAASIANKMINSYMKDKYDYQPEFYKGKSNYIVLFSHCESNKPLVGGWHTDYAVTSYDAHINHDGENPTYYKAILMLKGPGTLFCKPLETMHNRATYEEANEIGESCIKHNTVHQAKPGFGSVFIMSNTNIAAVHSSPSTDDNNYFKDSGTFYRLGFRFDGRINLAQKEVTPAIELTNSQNTYILAGQSYKLEIATVDPAIIINNVIEFIEFADSTSFTESVEANCSEMTNECPFGSTAVLLYWALGLPSTFCCTFD